MDYIDLLSKLNALFAYSFGRSADVLSEPLVDIIAALLDYASRQGGVDGDGEDLLRLNEPLLCNVEILLALLNSADNGIDLILQEKSAYCILTLIQLYPVYDTHTHAYTHRRTHAHTYTHTHEDGMWTGLEMGNEVGMEMELEMRLEMELKMGMEMELEMGMEMVYLMEIIEKK